MVDRWHQFVFTSSLVALSWLLMMAVHEFGHVLGAIVTGGSVERIVLHPLAISRTDVLPNPHPSLVVWLGPIVGCVLPLLVATILPSNRIEFRNIAKFFAGFCLVANGVYISIGAFDRVGDCGVMLATGSPYWSLLAFGAATIPLGLFVWHKIGSVGEFSNHPEMVTPRLAYTTAALMIAIAGLEFCLSPR
ncbi:MAG: M50 family metallopeptidase [Planctomycetes bacterium]|nr:M50 family metallopeptidase [Planctomycetota bacterium]